MKKNNKILKTILSLGTIATIATIAVVPTIQMTDTETKITATEDDVTISAVNRPNIQSVTFNNDQNNNNTYIEIDFTFSQTVDTDIWTFAVPTPFSIFFTWDGAGASYNTVLTNPDQPVAGAAIDFNFTYKVIFRADNLPTTPSSFYTNGTLSPGFDFGVVKDGTTTPVYPGLQPIGAVPERNITDPDSNFIAPAISEVVQTNNSESELTFNLNPTGIDTTGWTFGSNPKIIADDGVNTPIEITGFTTDVDTTPGVDIPTTDIVATFSNDLLDSDTTYDISLEYDLVVNDVVKSGSVPHTTQMGDYIGQTNSLSITILRTADPTILDLTITDDLSTLMFTLNLNNDLDYKARFLEGTTRPFALYYGDASSKVHITDDVITTTEVLPLEGESYAVSYDVTIDIATLQTNDTLWGIDDILESLTIAVGYENDDILVNPYTFSTDIGSIPRDPAPQTIFNTSIVTDETNAELTFELSDATTRGWEIGPDGVKIFATPSDGSDQFEITDATFDADLSVGVVIPQGTITATIPVTNFPETRLSYDIVIESNYAVSSTLVDIILDPVTITSPPTTFDSTVSVTNLVVNQGATAGEIDLTWDINFSVDANTIYYIAVRDTLLQEDGWKIYSSEQTEFLTVVVDSNTGVASATISDPNFIGQGSQYDISIAMHIDKTIADDIIYIGDAWTNWDGASTSAPVETIVVPTFSSGFATPTTQPSDITFTYLSSTSKSLIYEFTYDSGSLEFNPIITVEIDDGTGLVNVSNSDLNVIFDDNTGIGTVEILRLIPSQTYTEVILTYDYLINDPVSFTTFVNDATLPAASSITLNASLAGNTITLAIGGEAITNVIDPTNADVVITDGTGTSVLLSTSATGAFIGSHDVDVSTLDLTTDLLINVIAYDVATTPNPLTINDIIINDGISATTDTAITYTINEENAGTSLTGSPTSITPSKGVKNGELDLSWEVTYPAGISSLSQLGFTFEISTIDPEGAETPVWVDVTDQTSSFSDNMKSATISGLDGADYRGAVWVRLTIDYSNVEGYTPSEITSVIGATPKQPGTTAISPLSTGALIGIIVGSVAAVILIGLGLWFYSKNKNKPKVNEDVSVNQEEGEGELDAFDKLDELDALEELDHEGIVIPKKTTAKKSTIAKKAPVKKAAPKKTTTPKKAPVKKAVPTKAPVKKAVPKKTTTPKKKPPVKKPASKKTTTTKTVVTKTVTTKTVTPKKTTTAKKKPPVKKPVAPKSTTTPPKKD